MDGTRGLRWRDPLRDAAKDFALLIHPGLGGRAAGSVWRMIIVQACEEGRAGAVDLLRYEMGATG